MMTSRFAVTYPDIESSAYMKARFHYLLQILFAETMAIDYCSSIATFAPTDEARAFLLQQQREEDTHLELLTEYVGIHPRPEVLISPNLKKIHMMMVEAIEAHDYVASVFIQNFIVEGLNVSLLRELEHHADGVLSELCTRILRDEVRHMQFGVTEIRRILAQDTTRKLWKKLIHLQRKTLFYSMGLAFTLAREAKDLGIPVHEFLKKAVGDHTERISHVHLTLPFFDRVILFLLNGFLKFW